jgi:hypothetical protein
VISDNDGWFVIRQWGPRFAWSGGLIESEPMVRVFHPGFIPVIMTNTKHGYARVPADRILIFKKQDQEIVLKPFSGTLVEYEHELARITDSLSDFLLSPNLRKECLREDMPRLLNAMQRIKEQLQRQGAGTSIPSLDSYPTYCSRRAQ